MRPVPGLFASGGLAPVQSATLCDLSDSPGIHWGETGGALLLVVVTG